MKNLNLTFVAIIIAFFALTSCEKESMSEMTQNTATEINERNLPAAGINVVFDEVQTEATAASYKESANSRNRGYKEMTRDYDGCTINQGNSLDYRHYPNQIDALGARFDGQEEYFVWEVEAMPNMVVTHDLDLTGMSVDLDLFVFALNSNNQISAVKGMSINSGSSDETLSLEGLEPGIYIVVVDAYRSDIAGHYNLSMTWSALGIPESIYLKSIETTLGVTYPSGQGEWTFIATGSDMALVYKETLYDTYNISLQNVRQVGDATITTNIYLDLDSMNAARETTTVQSNGATSIGDEFGEILHIEYGN